MNNMKKRLTSLLLVFCITVSNTGCKVFKSAKNDIELDDSSVSVSDIDTSNTELEIAFKEFVASLDRVDGVDKKIHFTKKEELEITNLAPTHDCVYEFTGTGLDLIELIKQNTGEYLEAHSEYKSFFDDSYRHGESYLNYFGLELNEDDIKRVKEVMADALYNKVLYVLNNDTDDDIHKLATLSIVFVEDFANSTGNFRTYGVYENSENVIKISLKNILDSSNSYFRVIQSAYNAVAHELSHIDDYACSDRLLAGDNEKIDFLNREFVSSLREAENSSFQQSGMVDNPWRTYMSSSDYCYDSFRQFESCLFLTNAFDSDKTIADYYLAFKSSDLSKLYEYFSLITKEEQIEFIKIIYAYDATQARNNYAASFTSEDAKERYWQVEDSLEKSYFISILKMALINLAQYNVNNEGDLNCKDNLMLYYYIMITIADNAALADVDSNGEAVVYFYDSFCRNYKQIEESFFRFLSACYGMSVEEVEEMYKKTSSDELLAKINKIDCYDENKLTRIGRLFDKFSNLKVALRSRDKDTDTGLMIDNIWLQVLEQLSDYDDEKQNILGLNVVRRNYHE